MRWSTRQSIRPETEVSEYVVGGILMMKETESTGPKQVYGGSIITLAALGVGEKWLDEDSRAGRPVIGFSGVGYHSPGNEGPSLHRLVYDSFLAEGFTLGRDEVRYFEPRGMAGYVCVGCESHVSYHVRPDCKNVSVIMSFGTSLDAGWVAINHLISEMMPEEVYARRIIIPMSSAATFFAKDADFLISYRAADFLVGIEKLVEKCKQEKHKI